MYQMDVFIEPDHLFPDIQADFPIGSYQNAIKSNGMLQAATS